MFKSTEKETTVPSFKFVSKLTIFSSRQVCKKHLHNLSLTSKNCQRHPSNCAFSLCFYNYFWHYTRMQSWISKASSLNITSKKTSLTFCWPKAMKKQTNSQAPQCLVYLIHDTPYKLKTIPATNTPPQKQ